MQTSWLLLNVFENAEKVVRHDVDNCSGDYGAVARRKGPCPHAGIHSTTDKEGLKLNSSSSVKLMGSQEGHGWKAICVAARLTSSPYVRKESEVAVQHLQVQGLRFDSDSSVKLLEAIDEPWLERVAAGRPYSWQQDSFCSKSHTVMEVISQFQVLSGVVTSSTLRSA